MVVSCADTFITLRVKKWPTPGCQREVTRLKSWAPSILPTFISNHRLIPKTSGFKGCTTIDELMKIHWNIFLGRIHITSMTWLGAVHKWRHFNLNKWAHSMLLWSVSALVWEFQRVIMALPKKRLLEQIRLLNSLFGFFEQVRSGFDLGDCTISILSFFGTFLPQILCFDPSMTVCWFTSEVFAGVLLELQHRFGDLRHCMTSGSSEVMTSWQLQLRLRERLSTAPEVTAVGLLSKLTWCAIADALSTSGSCSLGLHWSLATPWLSELLGKQCFFRAVHR